MSERAWLEATDPGAMLDLLAGCAGYTGPPMSGRSPAEPIDPVWARKLRLFAVAQSRRLPYTLMDKARADCDRLVELATRYADRVPPPPPDPDADEYEPDELEHAFARAEAAFDLGWTGFLDDHDIDWKEPRWSPDRLSAWAGRDMALFCAEPEPWQAAWSAVELHETLAFRLAAKKLMTDGRVSTELDEDEEDPHGALEARLREAVGPGPVERERAELCRWLREVFGNPFHPPAGSPRDSETVQTIARRVYDTWDFAGLPVLADALEEAGCTDAEVLAHLRGPGQSGAGNPHGFPRTPSCHTRGCWALDWVLGMIAPRLRPASPDDSD